MERALIILDLQEDYFPGGVLPLFEAETVEARIVAAIAKARAFGDRIILVRHVSKSDGGLFAANGSGIAIRPRILAAAGAAPIVTKQVADAFQDTDLTTHLSGATELLVCGMMTQNCVVFTSMSRAADDYVVTIVGDLCAAPADVVHRIALNALASKRKVLPAAELWG